LSAWYTPPASSMTWSAAMNIPCPPQACYTTATSLTTLSAPEIPSVPSQAQPPMSAPLPTYTTPFGESGTSASTHSSTTFVFSTLPHSTSHTSDTTAHILHNCPHVPCQNNPPHICGLFRLSQRHTISLPPVTSGGKKQEIWLWKRCCWRLRI
jgi:hypothetical protein